MCAICDLTETMAERGEVACGSCGSTYDRRCSEGHWYCSCAEPMDPYDGGAPTPCFRCAAGF